MKYPLVTTALIAALAGFATLAHAANTEKCFGVSKAGENDCRTPAHGCAHHGSEDYAHADFRFVPDGTCAELKAAVQQQLSSQ
ncbi:BufA1 family periplasmic bufferin-type metallophore [Andreprevotia chitinilytica]|uniref:BufA1 family periplasmic bufferin-type metallophore n=1 Tax=Andreprevotia chitinilytica TaxID=396808 RepID=UPI00055521BA|nr:DUF2282 domain-containing protein [Andreprevotia chitinilytica]